MKNRRIRVRFNHILFGLSPELHRLTLTAWVAVKTTKTLRGKLFMKEMIKYIMLAGIIIIVKILRGLKIIKHKNIWLIGGASGRAYTDNSAVFHKYLISTYPEINTYWVANKNCRDINIISNIGPILYKRTIKLLIYLALAEVMIVSHSKSDIYPYNANMFENVVKIYLGHGVNAFKKKDIKGKNKTLNHDFNLLIANSAFEKSIKGEWGVDLEKIIITGLPRYDELFRKNNIKEQSKHKIILYMPTWREWIDNNKAEYERFQTEIFNMVRDKNLNEALSYHGYKIYIYFHINMQKYYETLINDNYAPNFVKLPLNIDLQEYIVASDLLITDYSSVAWDFLLLNKPVVFYQFDLNLFEHYRGSYIDFRNDLFGPSASNLSDLTNIIQGHFVNNLIMRDFKGKMIEWKDKMFTYDDQNNCERVAGEIINRLRQN